MRAHKNKGFRAINQAIGRNKRDPKGRVCVIWVWSRGELQHLSFAEASPLANLHADTHFNSESVVCKIKTSFSFSKPCCFAYTTLPYITVIMAVIEGPNSKMCFRGRGMIAVAGCKRESRSSGGGKWTPMWRTSCWKTGNTVNLKLDWKMY